MAGAESCGQKHKQAQRNGGRKRSVIVPRKEPNRDMRTEKITARISFRTGWEARRGLQLYHSSGGGESTTLKKSKTSPKDGNQERAPRLTGERRRSGITWGGEGGVA